MSKSKNKNYEIPSDYKVQRLYRKRKKRKNQLKKELRWFIVFALIQVVIIGVFLFSLSDVVDISNTETFTGQAEGSIQKESYLLTKKSRKVYFYVDSKEYLYQDLLHYHYDGDNVLDDLREGYLTVTVDKESGSVVELRSKSTVFYTLEDYNKTARTRNIMGISLMAVVELVYIAFFAGYLLVVKSSIKDVIKINKKIKNEV